jgi:hypothetical protein
MRSSTAVLMAMGLLVGSGMHVSVQGQEGTREPVPHDQVISANPILLLASWFNAEYERKLSNVTTAGFGGGWLSVSDVDYTNVNAFLRYYPQGGALTGFYVGGRLGVYNVEEDDEDSETKLGIGVDFGYSWLLGLNRTFYVGLGAGASRLFDGPFVPSVRLVNIGIAF